MSTTEFAKRAFIAVAVALVPVLVWYLFDVVLITVGALLIAELLNLGAEPFTRWLRCPRGIALALSGLTIFAILGGTAYLFGSGMAGELQDVVQRVGSGQSSILKALQENPLGKMVASHVESGGLSVSALPRVFTVSAGFVTGVLIMVIVGVLFAVQPELYRVGLVRLFPPRLHAEAEETIESVANALRLWLLGQLVEMAIIGLVSTAAVWLIGLPSPIALGLIAGVAEFVPYLGPIIAAVPAILVAATQGLHAVLWTLVAYVLIHQSEGNLIMPIIQRQLVYIPPAVILLGIAAIGSLFGALAIALASPIAVIVFVLVNKLYVRETLGAPARLPGEVQPSPEGLRGD